MKIRDIVLAGLTTVLISGCMTPNAVEHAQEIELKTVSVNAFMNNDLSMHIPIMLSIPKSYVHADVEAPATYSYWMPKEKIPNAKANQDLPSDTGWAFGNISLSVGYDPDKGEFFGDGGYTVDQVLAASGYEALEKERITVNGHPVLLFKVREKKTGLQFYTMYIGTLVATNNIFIAYRPPLDNPALGAYVWREMKNSIKESNKTN